MNSSHVLTNLQWHKSSYSGQGGDCVEVADLAIGVAVRDSKDPGGAEIHFGAGAWRAFQRHLKA
jgi:Domain of unknown function (DUF397).